MNATLTNPVIFMPVQITIFITAANVPRVVVTPSPARNPVDQALACIGFVIGGNRNNIHNEGGLEAFDVFVGLTVSDIQDMDSVFSRRTNSQGRINFGMWSVKNTLGIMHWAKDESRCLFTASLTEIADAKEYKALMGTALNRATLKKVEADQAETISKASDP